jgi:hypothetical protein
VIKLLEGVIQPGQLDAHRPIANALQLAGSLLAMPWNNASYEISHYPEM